MRTPDDLAENTRGGHCGAQFRTDMLRNREVGYWYSAMLKMTAEMSRASTAEVGCGVLELVVSTGNKLWRHVQYSRLISGNTF